MPTPLERSRSEPVLVDNMTAHPCATMMGTMRGQSLPGMNVPAGFSPILGNRLGLAAYANLSGRYQARLDVKPPCPAPRTPKSNQMAKLAVDETWFPPKERMKPETLPPAGGLVERLRGKRMLPGNTAAHSNADTVIFGRDLDGSMSVPDLPPEEGCAGRNMAKERMPAWGLLPPTAKRTFGDEGEEWNAVGYQRRDPRKDFHIPGIAQF